MAESSKRLSGKRVALVFGAIVLISFAALAAGFSLIGRGQFERGSKVAGFKVRATEWATYVAKCGARTGGLPEKEGIDLRCGAPPNADGLTYTKLDSTHGQVLAQVLDDELDIRLTVPVECQGSDCKVGDAKEKITAK